MEISNRNDFAKSTRKTFTLTIIGLMLAAMTIPAALATTTSWTNPGAYQQPGDTPWTNPTTAYEDGGDAATTTQTQFITYYGYGFSIPEGSTIDGIEVRLDAWGTIASTTRTLTLKVQLYDGTSLTTEKSITLTGTEPTTPVILGGVDDTWGMTWTSGIVNSTILE